MATLNVQQGPEQYHVSRITNTIIQQQETLTHITLDIWSNHLSIYDPFAYIACCKQLQVLSVTIAHCNHIMNIIAHAIGQCKQLHTVNIKFLQPTQIYVPLFTDLEHAIVVHQGIKNLAIEFADVTDCERGFLRNIVKHNNTISKYKFTGLRTHEWQLDHIIKELKQHAHVVEFVVDSIFADQINKILSCNLETFETELILSTIPSICIVKFTANTTLCNSKILESKCAQYAGLLKRNRETKAIKILVDITTCLYKLNLTVYVILEIVRHLLHRYIITDYFIVRTITKINNSINKLYK